jgi:DNA polymerase-1
MYDTMKDAEIREQGVFEKFGVRPEQVVDCQALTGDSSDNIPGVRGIGPKKAAELLNEFGTLEKIYENLDAVENDRARGLLAAGKESAFVSQKLARLKTDVEIPPYPPYRFDPESARRFFIDEVRSPSLAEKVRKLFLSDESQPAAPKDAPDGNIFFFDPDDYLLRDDLFSDRKTVQSAWGRLADKSVKKVAWDWKTIFHKLDDAGFDVSEIAPIDDVMLMNYANNADLSTHDLAADYDSFIRNPNKIYEMDLAILRPLFQMEKNGVLVDREKLGEISELLHGQADVLQTKIWDLAGEEFNIASPKQLAVVLFDKLRLPSDKKRSTDADRLSELAAENELARLVLEWRSATKLAGTYADALPRSIAADGRIHTTFLQTSTNTGRLSSVNPNLQNIPIKTEIGGEIRKCFIAPAGGVLISVDYSQIQLRILAHLTGEPVLKDAFKKGLDIHSETAVKIFGVLTPETRRLAKTINFSIIYGISAFGLAPQLGVSQREAASIIENYMAGLPAIRKYIEDTKKLATERGYVETPLGRRITFPDIKNPQMKNYALRAAVNAPIQGFEADIMRLAMAKLADLPIKMILQVHDEIVFECPAAEAKGYAEQIKEIMENIVSLSVPLAADYIISDRWGK